MASEVSGAGPRQRLSLLLRKLMRLGRLGDIPGRQPVGELIDRLADLVDPALGLVTELQRLYAEGRQLGSIAADEPLVNLCYFPDLPAATLLPPEGLRDPAELPGTGYGWAWFRTAGGLFLFPGRKSRTTFAERYTDGRWTAAGEWQTGVFLEPRPGGLAVYRVATGLLAPQPEGDPLMEPASALRLTNPCGFEGSLTAEPLTISLDGHTPAVPLTWSRPGGEIWINPLPDPPWGQPFNPRPGGYLPGGVIVGAPPEPVEPGGPLVLVGTSPGVRREDCSPWPPGWHWPFPPGNGGGSPGGFGFGWPGIIRKDPKLTVTIKGCPCIRRGEIAQYTGEPSEDGGAYEWSEEDNTIIEIQGPKDQKTVKVKGRDIGRKDLNLKYTKDVRKAESAKEIAVIYQRYTERDNPNSERTALPLIQPAPKARIARAEPAHTHLETDAGRVQAKFSLSFEGELIDALEHIRAVEVAAGEDFRVDLSASGNEYGRFDDTSFTVRKAEVWGPGRCYVRVRAQNDILFWGTDTLEVVIRIPEHWERILDSLARSKALMVKYDASPAEIAAYDDRIERALGYALENVEFDYAWLTHTDNATARAPGSEKWSVAAEDDTPFDFIEIATSIESHSLPLTLHSPKLLAPFIDPKNCFLLHQDYVGAELNWGEDGRILAAAGDPVSLVYQDACCGHAGPAVGVEMEPPGVRLIEEGETITLIAHGKPKSWLNVPGTYIWSCIAYPEGAQFSFEPDGPTTAETVKFLTDTPGVYTFKVAYQLLDAAGTWTYAVADGQIIFDIETRTFLHRLGDYSSDRLKPHLHRPYYRERTAEPQPGAEIMVENAKSGPLGKDFKVTLLTDPELIFEDTLVGKALYADGDSREFKLRLDPDAGYKATVTVRSSEAIERFQIIGIQYRQLPRLPRDAVLVEAIVTPIAPPIVDLEGPAAAPAQPDPSPAAASGGNGAAGDPGPTGVFIATSDGDDPRDIVPEEPERMENPLVNLILRTRDLGDAAAGHAMVGLSPFEQVNLTTGNQFIGLPFFGCAGKGRSLSPMIAFNSKAATRSYAVDLYRRLNQIDEEQIEREFGPEPLGPGWSSNFTATLFPFVDVAGDPTRPRLLECAEVCLLDGNRLVFRKEYTDEYTIANEAETVGDDPTGALSRNLTFDAGSNTWRLTDANDEWMIFDEAGRLTEIGDLRMNRPGNALEPLKLDWSDTGIAITDSAGRTTHARFNSGGLVDAVEAADGMTVRLDYADKRLETVGFPLGIAWGFGYGEQGLMTRIEAPDSHPVEIGHYLESNPVGPPRSIAQDFWGRAARLQFGQRVYEICYEARVEDNEEQVVICVTPERFRWRYSYEPARQAVTRAEFSGRDDPDAFRLGKRYLYQYDTKYLRETEDVHGAVHTYVYAAMRRSKARFMLAHTAPDGSMLNWHMDDQDRIDHSTDQEGVIQRYTYDVDRQIKQIDYPPLPSKDATLEDIQFQPQMVNTYDDQGRLTAHRSADGKEVAYGYGGPGDPHGTGLPTEETVAGQTGETVWDKMGRKIQHTSAYGDSVDIEYDELGREERIENGSYWVQNTYDGLNRVVATIDSEGRTTATKYDPYGEPTEETNRMGETRKYVSRDNEGNLLRMEDESGAAVEFRDYDALGRYGRMVTPSVARRPNGRNGLATAEMPETIVRYHDRPSDHSILGERLYVEERRSGEVVRKIYFDLRDRKVGQEEICDGVSKFNCYLYDPRGNLVAEEIHHKGQSYGLVGRRRFDFLGRVIEEFDGGERVRHYYSRDNGASLRVSVNERQDRQIDGPPATSRRIDDLDRVVAELDAEGKALKQWRYNDPERKCEIYAPPAGATDDTLHLVQTIEYNERAQVATLTNHLTGAAVTNHYDDAHRLDWSEANGERTTYRYDLLDRYDEIETSLPAAGAAVALSPAFTPPPTTRQSCIIKHAYDPLGRLESKGTDNARESFKYDALGRIIETTRTGIGVGGSLTEEHFYNDRGELIATWGGPDRYTRFRHDHDRLEQIETLHERGLEWVTRRKLDVLGNVIEVSADHHAFVFRSAYDPSGRVTNETVLRETPGGENEISQVAFDFDGGAQPNHLSTRYDGTERYIYLGYDSGLRLRTVEDSALSNDAFSLDYDRLGGRTGINRAEFPQVVTLTAFHANGRLRSMEHRFGDDGQSAFITEIDENDYDANGNPTRIRHRYIEDGQPRRHPAFVESEDYQYDEAGRLIAATYLGARAGLVTQIFGDYGRYLPFVAPIPGLLAQWLYSDTPSKVEKNYAFDGFDRRILEVTRLTPDLADPGSRQVIATRFDYGSGQAVEVETREWYDLGETTPRTMRRKFLYDEEGRRTHEIETLRNPDGNSWATMTVHWYGPDPKPIRTLVYELRGSLRHWTKEDRFVYGPGGEVAWSRHRTFGESTLADEDHTAALAGTYAELSDFESATVAPARVPTQEDEFHYVHAGSDLVAVLDKDGHRLQEFINGDGTNNRLAMAFNGDLFAYLNNYMGSALFLTQRDGDVEKRFEQTGSYGEAMQKIPEALHAGMWANLTAFLQTPARNFDPRSGQFLSPDPLGLAAGLNLYSFAGHNPISRKDPSGKYWESAWDVASLAIGYASFRHNVEQGNVAGATLDLIGMGIDLVALALPVPGGVGIGIKAVRTGAGLAGKLRALHHAQKAIRLARAGNTTLNTVQLLQRSFAALSAGIEFAYNRYQGKGHPLDFAFFALHLGLGCQKFAGWAMSREVMEQTLDNARTLKNMTPAMQKIYEKGSRALTDDVNRQFLRYIESMSPRFSELQPFDQVLTRGKLYDDFLKDVLPHVMRVAGRRWAYRAANWMNAFSYTLLKTGPTPSSLPWLAGASLGALIGGPAAAYGLTGLLPQRSHTELWNRYKGLWNE